MGGGTVGLERQQVAWGPRRASSPSSTTILSPGCRARPGCRGCRRAARPKGGTAGVLPVPERRSTGPLTSPSGMVNATNSPVVRPTSREPAAPRVITRGSTAIAFGVWMPHRLSTGSDRPAAPGPLPHPLLRHRRDHRRDHGLGRRRRVRTRRPSATLGGGSPIDSPQDREFGRPDGCRSHGCLPCVAESLVRRVSLDSGQVGEDGDRERRGRKYFVRQSTVLPE